MRESKYNVWFEHDGQRLCYNCLSAGFAQIDDKAYQLFMQLTQGCREIESLSDDERNIYQNMIVGRMITSDPDELANQKMTNRMIMFRGTSFNITVLPTLKCNFKCTYCYQEFKKKPMSDEVVDAVEKYIFSNLDTGIHKSFFINWFGGEPLLELETIKRISSKVIDYCTQKQINYGSEMISNCWLLTEDTAKVLKDCKVNSIQATIDGPRKIHNQKRVKADGSGTFDILLERIRAASVHIPIIIRINVEKNLMVHLDEMFDDLKCLAGNNQIGIYAGKLSADVTSACSSIEGMCMDSKEFAENSTIFYRKAIEHGFNLNWYSKSKHGGCGATKIDSAVIGPDGNMYRCWSQVGADGEEYANLLDYQKTFNPKNYFKWINYDPFSYQECVSCDVFPICMSGCPAKRVEATTDYMKPNLLGDKCTSDRYNLKDMLKLVYEFQKSRQQAVPSEK